MQNTQNDVANSGILPGRPVQFAGISVSVLPNGQALGSRQENKWTGNPISASGLNIKLGTRFDDISYYSN